MICKHDRLARSCNECTLIDDIADLESAHRMMHARNERLQKENDELTEVLREIGEECTDAINTETELSPHFIRNRIDEVLRKYGLEGKEE